MYNFVKFQCKEFYLLFKTMKKKWVLLFLNSLFFSALMAAVLIFFGEGFNYYQEIRNNVSLKVYFKDETSYDVVEKVVAELEKMNCVETTEYVSPEEGFVQIEEDLEISLNDLLTPDIVPGALVVKLKPHFLYYREYSLVFEKIRNSGLFYQDEQFWTQYETWLKRLMLFGFLSIIISISLSVLFFLSLFFLRNLYGDKLKEETRMNYFWGLKQRYYVLSYFAFVLCAIIPPYMIVLFSLYKLMFTFSFLKGHFYLIMCFLMGGALFTFLFNIRFRFHKYIYSVVVLFFLADFSFAQDIDKTRNRIDSLERVLREDENELKNMEKKSAAYYKEKRIKRNKSLRIQKELNELRHKLSDYEKNYLALNSEKTSLREDIDEMENRLENILRAYYLNKNKSDQFYLAGFPFGGSLENTPAYHRISYHLEQGFMILEKRLAEKETELNNIEMEKESIKKLSEKKKRVKKEYHRQNKMMDRKILTMNQKKAELKKKYDREREAKTKLVRLLSLLEKERKSKNKVETELDYSFLKLKKRLSWPVIGAVEKRFGAYRDPDFNTKTFMNGIEIEIEQTSFIKSIATGLVRLVDYHRGYGNFVVIEHPEGYYAIYAYLSKVVCSLEQTVFNGQNIGVVNKDDKGRLFFAIYKGREALNPEDWLE